VPTIAHHLASLERHFGVQLVERDRRGARLTPLGAVFTVEAEDILVRLDRAERHDPAFATADLEFNLLLEADFQVLVARDSPYAAYKQIDLPDLVDADWICSRDENETSDRVLHRACHLIGFDPKVLMRTDDLNMIHGLVAEGLACTLTTRAAVDTRFAVEARPAVQDLGLRRTSYVRRSTLVPKAVDELQRILVGLLP